ncbi:MAG: type II secretion system protein [Dehalococcoidales bacterium]|nr:type II secretion system protein [Dehalococcoidales bacterium]
MPPSRKISPGTSRESGATLLETVVALAILGTIVVVFLGGIFGTTKAAAVADAQTTAESLAQSQMERVQNATYATNATGYTPAALLQIADYANYSVSILAAALHSPDDGIQKITVTVSRDGRQVFNLEGYKVNR